MRETQEIKNRWKIGPTRERTSCTSFVRCNDMWLAKDNFKTLLLLVIQDGRAVLILGKEEENQLYVICEM